MTTSTPASGATAGEQRDTWVVLAAFIAMVSLIGAIAAVGFAIRAADDARGSQVAAAGGSGPIAPIGTPQHVALEEGDLYIKPASITVPAGTPLVLEITNKGKLAHNLMVGEKMTADIPPGGSATLETAPIMAKTVGYCAVPGHKEAGMTFTIDVTGGSGSGSTQASAGGSSSAAASADATIDPAATPPSGWTAYDPTLKPADGATEHKVTFHATEKVLEVAPGVKQQMWTFNDTVPGPVLHGKVGDLFTVTLVNDGKIGHSIDFHASQTAMDVNMRTLQPGESLVYQFRAEHSGVWMYHCGTAPTLHHIGNGMYGAVVIDPPSLAPVDHEYLLVQSELYLGPPSQPGDLTKMTNFLPDAVVFNGYYAQYKFAPIHVDAKQRIRIWLLDAGPNENSSFHIVGTQFDTVFKEGAYLLRPGNAEKGASQALDLQPAQGGFVELQVPEDGMYVIVTHKFANVGKGAVGQLIAGAGGS